MPPTPPLAGEINGKSNNINYCLKNVIYRGLPNKPDSWQEIPEEDLVVIFDADMICEPHFFTRMLEVMVNREIALCLSPQCFHNSDLDSDLYNNINMFFWDQWICGADAWGMIVCTGAVRGCTAGGCTAGGCTAGGCTAGGCTAGGCTAGGCMSCMW